MSCEERLRTLGLFGLDRRRPRGVLAVPRGGELLVEVSASMTGQWLRPHPVPSPGSTEQCPGTLLSPPGTLSKKALGCPAGLGRMLTVAWGCPSPQCLGTPPERGLELPSGLLFFCLYVLSRHPLALHHGQTLTSSPLALSTLPSQR